MRQARGTLREIEWAATKDASSLFVTVENALEEYGPWQWAKPFCNGTLHVSPPPRPPRAIRSHYRWSWRERLTCNAWWGPSHLRITVAGVPAFLAVK